MSEEFQGGVCGGNWWPVNSTTNYLFRSSPCSSAINDPSSGSFGWLNHDQPSCNIIDNNTRSKSDDDSAGSAASDASIVLQHVQNPSDENVSSSIFTSALQSMGINDDDWNQNLLHDGDNIGRSEQNYCNQILQATSQLDLINSSIMNNNNNYGQNGYGSCYNSSSSLLQTLFDPDARNAVDHQYLLDNNNRPSTIYHHHQPSPNFMDSTDFRPKLMNSHNNLQFNNNTPFWNAPASNFLPSSQPQLALPSPPNPVKPKLHTLTTKQRNQESSKGLKKVGHEPPPVKRPRIETPSPLPAFKVRKEKLGDRVTALQQLVSPFGKTDTASVLHEAIEYIKFLHDQVSVLSTPYMKKNGTPQLQNYQQGGEKKKDDEIQDLISRGLCLVPISSTFPVAAETSSDFWTPTFGGCFR